MSQRALASQTQQAIRSFSRPGGLCNPIYLRSKRCRCATAPEQSPSENPLDREIRLVLRAKHKRPVSETQDDRRRAARLRLIENCRRNLDGPEPQPNRLCSTYISTGSNGKSFVFLSVALVQGVAGRRGLFRTRPTCVAVEKTRGSMKSLTKPRPGTGTNFFDASLQRKRTTA